MATRNLKFLLYSIHGHIGDKNPDYADLFHRMVALRGFHREEGKKQIAIGSATLVRDGQRLEIVAYIGDKEKSIMFFDVAQQTEFNEVNEPTRFQARKTHVLVDPARRQMLIETGRGMMTAEELCDIIETQAKTYPEYANLELTLAPVAAPAFLSKIERLERIQAATVTIARPNVDWGDNYQTQLAQLADDSEGGVIETTVRSRRNDSLSKTAGIIPTIKRLLSQALPAVKNAKINGSYDDDSGLVLLKLSDYTQTANVKVEVKPDTGQPLESDVSQKLNTHLDSVGNA